ncbi:MAG: hypothetical protein RJA70_248 [Pseudomonadota bacterium]|jgi:hypothetical protein
MSSYQFCTCEFPRSGGEVDANVCAPQQNVSINTERRVRQLRNGGTNRAQLSGLGILPIVSGPVAAFGSGRLCSPLHWFDARVEAVFWAPSTLFSSEQIGHLLF